MTKAEKYSNNLWKAHVPPTCTFYWDIGTWISWIDYAGKWLDNDKT